MKRLLIAAGAVTAFLVSGPGASAAPGAPTCSTTLGIAVHGQHIIGDYVIGTGVGWPPAGSVGQAIAGKGANTPGGPGPGFHFVAPAPGPFAPGASFCLAQSQSPNTHLGLG
jgi:hypothetical protein